MREEELQLGVPQLVEHAVDRHVAHRRRGAEARHPRLELAGLILGERHGAVVQLEHARPAFVGLVVELGARQRRLHRVRGRILLALDVHVFAVGDLVGLVEGLPLLGGDAVGIAHLGRKELLLRDVGGRPVGIPRDIVPLGAFEHRQPPTRQRFRGAAAFRRRLGNARHCHVIEGRTQARSPERFMACRQAICDCHGHHHQNTQGRWESSRCLHQVRARMPPTFQRISGRIRAHGMGPPVAHHHRRMHQPFQREIPPSRPGSCDHSARSGNAPGLSASILVRPRARSLRRSPDDR